MGRDRADFLGGDASLDPGRPHGELIQQWFDPSRFAQNAAGTFGSSGRNILRGPGLFNTDLGVLKNTGIAEQVKVQFRAEFFNIFNNVNFYGPDNTLTSGNTGRIFGARSPRILQFGLKLLF